MSQSNYIVAAIAIAFMVYITVKGSLSNYITLLTGGAGFGEDVASAGNPEQQTASVDQSTGSPPSTETAENETSGSGAANVPLTILQQVARAGGPADEVLDAVSMFGLIG